MLQVQFHYNVNRAREETGDRIDIKMAVGSFGFCSGVNLDEFVVENVRFPQCLSKKVKCLFVQSLIPKCSSSGSGKSLLHPKCDLRDRGTRFAESCRYIQSNLVTPSPLFPDVLYLCTIQHDATL